MSRRCKREENVPIGNGVTAGYQPMPNVTLSIKYTLCYAPAIEVAIPYLAGDWLALDSLFQGPLCNQP